MNSKIYKQNEDGKIIDFVQNLKPAKNITEILIQKAIENPDNEWINRSFNSSFGKILFTNGYYDFKINKFIEFNSELYDNSIIFLEQINYDFKDFTNDDLKYIEDIKTRLFTLPFGKEVGEYYILNLARGLAGDCMKRCLFGIGSSNTGKSMITSAIKSSCGGYYGGFNAVNIACKNSSQDEAQKLRWLMLLQTKRIIISNEIQMGVEIDGNMIKKISNGGLDDITARGHSQNENNFKIGFLPIIFCNDIDKIRPMDDAVINRIRAIEYKKICVDRVINSDYEIKRDDNLINEIETIDFKRAFIGLLINLYNEFQNNNRIEIEPEEVKKCKNEITGGNKSIIELFLNDYEITNNEDDFIKSNDIEEWLKPLKISITKFGMEMNKYININQIKNVYSKDKKINGKTKKVWIGIKCLLE
jgi:hypothetical protein